MKRYCAWPGWGSANIVTDAGASVSRAQRRAAGLVEMFGAGERRRSRAGGKEQQQSASLADAALSWLEVFVVGLGEEQCDQKDTECLKRQSQHN